MTEKLIQLNVGGVSFKDEHQADHAEGSYSVREYGGSEKKILYSGLGNERLNRELSEDLKASGYRLNHVDSVLVHAQNVHDYFMEHYEDHGWMDLTSFFCVKPPYQNMLFSYDHGFREVIDETGQRSRREMYQAIHDGATGIHTGRRILRHVGVSVRHVSREEIANIRIGQIWSSPGQPNFYKEEPLPATEGEKETLLMTILDEAQPDSILGIMVNVDGHNMPGKMFVLLDPQGKIIEWRGVGFLFIRTPEDRAKIADMDVPNDTLQAAFQRHTAISLAAIQFMHCKNVEVVDNPPKAKLVRRAKERGEKPPVSYKTLVIHPLRKVSATGTAEAATPATPTAVRALHICRGHFKDYRSGAGLGRGHAHGLWWWPAMVRGSAEAGRGVQD